MKIKLTSIKLLFITEVVSIVFLNVQYERDLTLTKAWLL